ARGRGFQYSRAGIGIDRRRLPQGQQFGNQMLSGIGELKIAGKPSLEWRIEIARVFEKLAVIGAGDSLNVHSIQNLLGDQPRTLGADVIPGDLCGGDTHFGIEQCARGFETARQLARQPGPTLAVEGELEGRLNEVDRLLPREGRRLLAIFYGVDVLALLFEV